MERDDNFKKVTAIKSHNPNHLGDINGGLLYKEMKQPGGFLWPANNNNITLTCFTDGVPLFKSSKVSLWPLYLVINELPPAERFLRKNMMVWGIWQGNDKLRMNTFLYPFVQDLQKLHSEGFTFNDGPKKKSGKALLVIATMDLMARAPVLNMMHHNGECGCIYCETPGITVPSGKGHARSYPYLIDTFQPRTDASVEMNSRLAVDRNKVSVGIKGPSVLHAIPRFSLTKGTAIDYMHGALLGIVKKLMELWFHGKSYQMTYFIGHEITDIDCMLKKIKPPYVLKRLPRRIENNYQHWKASEMRSWLLYYSLPCISESSLPEVYIHHYACLVEAIYLLLGEDISESDLQRAERLLNSFYEHFAELYMDSAVGLNVHNLYHLVQCVRYWGPLWVYSCFGFDKDVLEVVHGTGNVAMQILWCLKAQKELALKTKTLPDGKIKDFFKDMLKGGSRRLPKGIHAQHCRVVQPMGGTFRFNDAVASNLKELFEDDSISEKHFFKSDKIVYGQIILYSKNCTRVKKRNSYTIEIAQQHLDGSDIMQVDYFLMKKDTKQVVAVCTLLRMVRPVVRGRAPHCQIVEKQR
ncbi:hypothetical protein FSP39_013796 [Pinctada imbricata]|uniref:Uncharacterized protein n=1 Tax=Pinctada imbricata TaxID=66713 RepID=A0AA88YKK2_PINIB|nr:hypothetical protein FSP39_013796 [Pinctada imbricata]